MDFADFKFDIVVIAGQSNAEGNGLPSLKDGYHNENVYELSDNSLTLFGYGDAIYSRQTRFDINYATYRKSSYRYYLDFSEPFVDEYISSGYLDGSRKILIIKAAVGGTGFSLRQWGVNNPLHNRLKDMISFALSLNKENRLVAFLWHQGEHDAFELKDLDPISREKFYYSNLKSSIEDIRTSFNTPTLPFIAGEMVDSWANKNLEATRSIEKATKEVCNDIGFAYMVSSEGLKSNVEEDESVQDDIHFSMISLVELGKRYFLAFNKIKENR